jgi:hypothetical protein
VGHRQAESYSRYLDATEAYETLVFSMQHSEHLMSAPWELGTPGREALDAAFAELRASMGDVRLVASFPVAFAAVALATALVPAFGDLRPDHDFGPYGCAKVDFTEDPPGNTLVERRNAFVGAARRELGLADVGVVSGSRGISGSRKAGTLLTGARSLA